MATPDSPEQTVIYPARWRVLVNVILYAAFIATGLALLATPDQIPRLIGAAVVVYFSLLEAYALKRVLVRTPSLVVDARGILDNTSIIGVGRIHWHEITNIEMKKSYLARHIAVTLRDKAAVLARTPAPRDKLVKLVCVISDDTISLNPGFLEMPLHEVESLLLRCHARYGQGRGD